MPGNSDLIDLQVYLHKETEKAILVSDSGDTHAAVWLPKSQVEFYGEVDQFVDISLPEWLAEREGLS